MEEGEKEEEEAKEEQEEEEEEGKIYTKTRRYPGNETCC